MTWFAHYVLPGIIVSWPPLIVHYFGIKRHVTSEVERHARSGVSEPSAPTPGRQ